MPIPSQAFHKNRSVWRRPMVQFEQCFYRNGCTANEASPFGTTRPGVYSPTRRGQNYNPGYNAVDVALFKTTQITERVSTQFRRQRLQIFNRTNCAPVGFPQPGKAV